ncbi:hypothetical protein AB0M28_33855 [Streptomyces sp. NPDC051940]|uniref:hypothetical protein n=1 Tax=Streptomyces sp. NPDC051940 TaxID=3155675 RepID=UPI00344193AA
MDLNLHGDAIPSGLTRRARSFLGVHGVRVDVTPVEEHRRFYLERDVPAGQIDRMAAFQERWGGLVLPPAPGYEGGPRYFEADSPEGSTDEGWWFEAGMQRASVPFGFYIGPDDEFGIHAGEWAPLHATIEGWVESLALVYHARLWAQQITKVTGDDVDGIDLDGFEPVREVVGLADTWWRGADTLVAVYSGEAEAMSFPRGRTAYVYSGLDSWGLYGGVDG